MSRQEPARRLDLTPAFLSDLLSTLTERGRALLRGTFSSNGTAKLSHQELIQLGETLLSRRGEATGVALAHSLLAGYAAASEEDRALFLKSLADRFGADHDRLDAAIDAYRAGDTNAIGELHQAAEPRRQELIRRLNLAPGGTAALVQMREALLTLLSGDGELRAVDRDFVHLFASWFNRGFLVLRRIDWTTPAHILEKIIRYEAVHAIEDWDDLRNRLAPADRRCYAFFHPQLVDEPLIFVEVALTKNHPRRHRAAARPVAPRDRRAGRDDRRVLLDLQHAKGSRRHFLRQLPDQAGGRGAEAGPAEPADLRDAVAGAGICRLAGEGA